MKTLQLYFAFLGGFLGFFIGEINGLLIALVLFCVIDYITGVMNAIAHKKLSSVIGFKGIFKKVMIFFLVGIANIIDTQILKDGSILRTATIFFYLSNEGISILENSSCLGVPFPTKLKSILEQLKEDKGNDRKKD